MINEIILLGFFASLAAGLATGAGALPALFVKNISDKVFDTMLGFSAGVMLAATSFSLIVPAIDLSGPWVAVSGVILGASVLHIIEHFVPHFHPTRNAKAGDSNLSKVWLFILAMTIHNFPEGLAVGVSFGVGDVSTGLVMAMAIGLQNMPEGLAVALPLLREGYSRQKALWYGTLTGLVEPLGGLLGVAMVSLFKPFLPWGLVFAAGAMLFVVGDQLIPESHSKGFEKEATFGMIGGFVIMMLLDFLFT